MKMLNCVNSDMSGHIHRLSIAMAYVGSREYQTYSIPAFNYIVCDWAGTVHIRVKKELYHTLAEGIVVTIGILLKMERPGLLC